MQKITDPFAGAARDKNGTILYTISEKEMESKKLNDEEHLKSIYEKLKLKSEDSEIDFEDEEELNSAVYKELDGKSSPFEVEKFHEQLDKELGVF